MSAHIHQMIPLYAAKSSNSASAATSPKALQKPDCATASIGSMKAAQSFLVSAFRQKDLPPGPLSCEERGSRTKRCLNTRWADRNVCPTFTHASSTARGCRGAPVSAFPSRRPFDPSTSSGTAGSGSGSGCSRPSACRAGHGAGRAEHSEAALRATTVSRRLTERKHPVIRIRVVT